jgi:hypothetical protein
MGKAIVILMIVLGIWIGLEVFTKGTDQAFGGVFASGDAASRAPAEAPLKRIRASAQRSADEVGARIERGIGEASDDEAGDEE